MRKVLALMLSLMLCASLALPAFAASNLHRPTHGSLDLSYTFEDEHGVSHALDHVLFDLYLVATFDDAHALVNTPKFAEVALDQNLFYNQDLLIDTCNRLDHFVNTNTLTSNYHAYTNKDGEARVDALPLGLYFIKADLYWNDEFTHLPVHAYYSSPFLVQIGARDPETGDYLYDFAAMPKIATIQLDENDNMSVSVRKEWKNTANIALPQDIEVELYCDGCCDNQHETAILNKANNWTYTWTGLDPSKDWGVKEINIPNDYEVYYETTIDNEQLVYVITNTFTGTVPTPTPTATPTAPVVTPTPTATPTAPVVTPTPTATPTTPVVTPTPTATPTAPVVTPTPTATPTAPVVTPTATPSVPVVTPAPTPTPAPQLPQTGSHLPYVPVFAGLGMGLILVGMLLNKGGEAK